MDARFRYEDRRVFRYRETVAVGFCRWRRLVNLRSTRERRTRRKRTRKFRPGADSTNVRETRGRDYCADLVRSG